MGDLVKMGDYVIIQRQNYKKIHKMTPKTTISLGKDQIEITAIVGEPFWTTYKLEAKGGKNRNYTLVKCKGTTCLTSDIIKECSSGSDNREIVDDGSSQKLSTDDIVNLRSSGMSAQGIVSHLVENSKTFLNKTEYSQEKYLRKKEKKYFEYLTIRKPTFRQVAEILLKNGPSKMLGLRTDTIAQLTTLACVRAGGNYMLYESGCQGLVAAAMLNSIGTSGTIVYVHPGQAPPKHAVLSLNWTAEQLACLVTVNIQTLLKGIKYCDEPKDEVTEMVEDDQDAKTTGEDPVAGTGKRKADHPPAGVPAKRARWKDEANRALDLVKSCKLDGLVIVGREHPTHIFTALAPYLGVSRPFVVFCGMREPLQDLYGVAKARTDVISLRLTESWLRSYQVLPDRTHPDINMSGSGGCLLSGIMVEG